MNQRKKILRLRQRRAGRSSAKIFGSAERPRLAVHRSNRFMYAQLIDDTAGRTLAHASSKDFKGAKSARAREVGALVGARAVERGIKKVVFDRRQYKYHGRVKAVAEGARGAGLQF